LRKRSTYLWAHFHDLLPESYCPNFVHPAPFAQRALDLLGMAELPADPEVLVAGCGPGREALELATWLMGRNPDTQTTITACDVDPALLSCLHALIQNGRLDALFRASVDLWHSPEPLVLSDPLRKAAHVIKVLCIDMLDPPFAPGQFDLIVALNVLDNVTDPLALINQFNLQLKPGGYLLLSTPFAWHTTITPRDKRLSFAVPHARMSDQMVLEKLLMGAFPMGFGAALNFRSVAADRLTWHLRVHDTHYQTYIPSIGLWRKDD
ncbi:MAG: class I SAM-dependent methyltransferase, partial [Myxococcota bacterium]